MCAYLCVFVYLRFVRSFSMCLCNVWVYVCIYVLLCLCNDALFVHNPLISNGCTSFEKTVSTIFRTNEQKNGWLNEKIKRKIKIKLEQHIHMHRQTHTYAKTVHTITELSVATNYMGLMHICVIYFTIWVIYT